MLFPEYTLNLHLPFISHHNVFVLRSQAHHEPERYLGSILCVCGGSAAGYGGSTGSVLDPGTQ